MRAVRLLLAGLEVARAHASIRFWTAVAYVRLRAHGAQVGRGLRVRGPIRLRCHRTGAIRIGPRVRIQSGFAGNAVGGGQRMSLWVGRDAVLTIGAGAGLSNSTIVCLREVEIGDGVFLGGDSKVYDTDFHSLDADQRARPGNVGARTAPVVIGPRAFVGGHSILLKGTSVGEASIVGAGSVVRGRVPPGELWTGNPAGPVRVRLKPAREREGAGMPAEAWP